MANFRNLSSIVLLIFHLTSVYLASDNAVTYAQKQETFLRQDRLYYLSLKEQEHENVKIGFLN